MASENPFDLPSGTDIADQTFRNVDASGQTARALVFFDCTFRGVRLTEATLVGCRFAECAFIDCDLSLASLPDSSFVDVRMQGCKLIGIDWTAANWGFIHRIDFRDCNLSHSNFFGLSLKNYQFADCQVVNCNFSETDLTAASFGGCTLRESTFLHTNLSKADLSGARDYAINVQDNRITGARFALPEALALLRSLDIKLHEG